MIKSERKIVKILRQNIMEEQIKYRRELIGYFKNKLIKSEKETNAYKTLLEVAESQLELLKQQDEDNTLEALHSLMESIKSAKLLPIDLSRMNVKSFEKYESKVKDERLLIMDINYILPEYKDLRTEEVEKIFEDKYNCKVLFIDSSRVNIQGTNVYPPIQLL